MLIKPTMHCHNRPPYKDRVWVRTGFVDAVEVGVPRPMRAGEVRLARLAEIRDPMSKSCRVDVRFTHPGCVGCHWRHTIDHRDDPETQGRVAREILAAGWQPVLNG